MDETKIDLHEVYARVNCQVLREASSEAAKAGNHDEAEFWGCALNKFMQARQKKACRIRQILWLNGTKERDMSATNEKDEVIFHTARGDMTGAEFDEIVDKILEAHDRGDEEEVRRLARLIPLDHDFGMVLKLFYGKNEVLEGDWDLTEANMKFGEGWLDA